MFISYSLYYNTNQLHDLLSSLIDDTFKSISKRQWSRCYFFQFDERRGKNIRVWIRLTPSMQHKVEEVKRFLTKKSLRFFTPRARTSNITFRHGERLFIDPQETICFIAPTDLPFTDFLNLSTSNRVLCATSTAAISLFKEKDGPLRKRKISIIFHDIILMVLSCTKCIKARDRDFVIDRSISTLSQILDVTDTERTNTISQELSLTLSNKGGTVINKDKPYTMSAELSTSISSLIDSNKIYDLPNSNVSFLRFIWLLLILNSMIAHKKDDHIIHALLLLKHKYQRSQNQLV